MKIMITGGCGFQGSHLSESYAKEGHEVVILNTPSKDAVDNHEKYLKKYPNIRVVWGSCNDMELVEKSMLGCSLVFNLAGKINVDESIEKPYDYVHTNIVGTLNVLEAVRKNNIPLVHVSTCEVYGANVTNKPMDENHPLNPHSPYAASKLGGERMVHAYVKTHNIKAIILRPFNIYGPRQKADKFGAVIPKFFYNAKNNIPIKIFGDGKQKRDYNYIDDMIECYRKIAAKNHLFVGQVVNIGSGKEVEIKHIADMVTKLVPNSKIVYEKARSGEVTSFMADNTKIMQFIDLKPKTMIDEGIKKYWLWLNGPEN